MTTEALEKNSSIRNVRETMSPKLKQKKKNQESEMEIGGQETQKNPL